MLVLVCVFGFITIGCGGDSAEPADKSGQTGDASKTLDTKETAQRLAAQKKIQALLDEMGTIRSANERRVDISSPGEPGDGFAEYKLDVANNVIAVGASRDDGAGKSSGALYLFSPDGKKLAKIQPKDAAADALFGDPVKIVDGRIYASATQSNGFLGAVYVYDLAYRKQLDKLTADGTMLGFDVAVSEKYVAATASLGTVVMIYDQKSGEPLRKIVPIEKREALDIAIVDDYLVCAVGERFPFSQTQPAKKRKFFLHVYNISTGELLYTKPGTYGFVAAYDDVMIVARKDGNAVAEVFSIKTGEKITSMVPKDSRGITSITSVDVHNGIAVVGGKVEEGGMQKAAAWVFLVAKKLKTETRREVVRLDGVRNFEKDFPPGGVQVAIDDHYVVLSDSRSDEDAKTRGMVHVFKLFE